MSRYSGTAHPGLADGKNDKKLASSSGWPLTLPKAIEAPKSSEEALPPSRNCIRPPGTPIGLTQPRTENALVRVCAGALGDERPYRDY
jgi:hypothetical protein